jgi:hypothetical protein
MTDLQREVLEEFEEAAVSQRCVRFSAEAAWEADVTEHLDEKRQRSRAEILVDLHRLEAIEDGFEEVEYAWRVCPECLVSFAVLLPERGRPRVHCCGAHRVLGAVRAWRRR